MLRQKQLKKGKIYSGLQFDIPVFFFIFIESFMVEKSEWQELEAVGPIISAAKKQRVMSACAMLRSSFV